MTNGGPKMAAARRVGLLIPQLTPGCSYGEWSVGDDELLYFLSCIPILAF